MSVIDRTDLWFRGGSSDKVYQAEITKQGSGYVVNFAYGRRGSNLKTGSKTTNPVSLSDARKIYDKLIAEKTSKGYQVTRVIDRSQSASHPNNPVKPIPVVAPATFQSTVQCNLLNHIDEESEVDHLLRNGDWYCQPKLDGVRFLLEKKGKHIRGYNRKGIQVAVPIEIFESIRAADAYYEDGCPNFLIDGELIGNVHHSFDILEHDDKDVRGLAFHNRIALLEQLFSNDLENDHLKFVRAAQGKEKIPLYEQLQKDNKEGVVFKNKYATYTPGRPSSGGSYLKRKFYSTASCVVSEISNKKRSVGVRVYEQGIPVFIGNCTIPVNHPIPNLGDVVEIKYLYAYKNGSLYQPIYLGVRSDIDENDCIYSQLKFKSEND